MKRWKRWVSGISCTAKESLKEINSFEVLDTKWLPPGKYTFHFAVDDNEEGTPDATWFDSVEVNIQ